MLDVVRTTKYLKNAEHSAPYLPCVVCGRGVRSQRHVLHLHCSGNKIVTEAEAVVLNAVSPGMASQDMSYFPIGSDCLKSHPEYLPYVTSFDRSLR